MEIEYVIRGRCVVIVQNVKSNSVALCCRLVSINVLNVTRYGKTRNYVTICIHDNVRETVLLTVVIYVGAFGIYNEIKSLLIYLKSYVSNVGIIA